MLTPLTAEGRLDIYALRSFCSFLGRQPIYGLVVGGTTGEGPWLEACVRLELLAGVRSHLKFQPLMFNISHPEVDTALSLLQGAGRNANAVLVSAPLRSAGESHSEAEIEEFFEEVLRRARVPVYLYNIPRLTGGALPPEMILSLKARHPRTLAGVKDSGGDVSFLQTLKAAERPGRMLTLLNGSDLLTVEALAAGAHGVISGACNPFPSLMMRLLQCFEARCSEEAQFRQAQIVGWVDAFSRWKGAEIPILKAGMTAPVPDFPLHVLPPSEVVPREHVPDIRRVVHSTFGLHP